MLRGVFRREGRRREDRGQSAHRWQGLGRLFCRQSPGKCPSPSQMHIQLTLSLYHQGECRSNVPEDGRNAVTWGVFPGQEIAQSTIIERESFLSWKVRLSYNLSMPLYRCSQNRMKHFRPGLNGHRSTVRDRKKEICWSGYGTSAGW